MPTPQMVNCQRIECSFDHFVGLTLKGIKVSKTLPSTQWNLFDVWLLSFKWSCQKLLKQLFGVGFKKSSNYLNYLKYSRIFPGHFVLNEIPNRLNHQQFFSKFKKCSGHIRTVTVSLTIPQLLRVLLLIWNCCA